ncbi:MAG: matrixin family metalloprotease [Planctomycetota bacterium]
MTAACEIDVPSRRASHRHWLTTLVILITVTCWSASSGSAFVSNGRWSFTAGGGATGLTGSPATLTWSIVPDNTFVPGLGSSDLVSFLDSNFGAGDGGGDLQTRPWFDEIIKPSFDRWTEISGLIFKYEENDDGVTLGSFSGALGTRGDVRLGGTLIDGPGGTDAQAGFIPNSDITIDTGDVAFYSDPANDFRNFRNTLMHEIGHSLGLAHLDSTADFLLEPAFDDSFDGVQIDDIRGVQQLYGDKFERDELGPNPNNSLATATQLGSLSTGQIISLGMDAGAITTVTPGQNDFVSIANLNDVDFFSFSIDTVGVLDVVVTPTGPNYFEKPSGPGSFSLTRSSQVSDLEVELYGPLAEGGSGLLASSDDAPIGLPESLMNEQVLLPGTYTVRIAGSTNLVQLYQLRLSLTALDSDFDGDGDTDGGDFLAWQRGFGETLTPADLAAWSAAYGATPQASPTLAVPEPTSLAGITISFIVLCSLWKAQDRSNR